MAEPEEVLIDGARHATEAVARLWRRRATGRGGDPHAYLTDERARLRLLLLAVHGSEPPLRAAQTPAPPTVLRRLFTRLPRALIETRPLPGTDGHHVFLPPRLAPLGELAPDRLYRLLALREAARARRLAALVPPWPLDGPVADFFQLCEADAVDTELADALPGLRADLLALRAAVLADRPPMSALTPAERAVENLYRQILAAPTATPSADATASLAWATATAADLLAAATGRYRLIRRDYWSGELRRPTPSAALTRQASDPGQTPPPRREGQLPRRPDVREAEDDEDDQPPGPWMLQMDDPQEHVEDPMGLQRPIDRDETADPDQLGDSLSELSQARLVASPEPAREVLVGDDPPARRAQAEGKAAVGGIVYPEWDCQAAAYRERGAVVRVRPAALGPEAWVERVLTERRRQLDEVRRRFEGLRPRRAKLGRQLDGEELDLDAYVDGHGDRRAGRAPDERLYQTVRPARRDIALLLLIDVSGSTDAWVEGHSRIVDVEKEALLVVCHALRALGDPYAIQAFSGEGPEQVHVWPVKDFEERDDRAVLRRVAALEPERYTRAGAAVRHASAALAQRPERHRLLLLLSDGKPNDIDRYEGRYGVEDLRQAVAEATLAGIHCVCLTVDRQAPAYLPAVFGPGRYAVLRHPRNLPAALVEVLRQHLRAG